MAQASDKPRKYPRIRAPKGTWVAWKSLGKTATSRMETMGLGGLYLHDANPPAEGSTIELLFNLPTGQVRARAIVRNTHPAKGMGIQFVQMQPEDRAKLHQFLTRQAATEATSTPVPVVSLRKANTQSANSTSSACSQLALSPRTQEAAKIRFEKDVKRLIELTGKGTYYQLLGVTSESPESEFKKSYYAMARKFHPDNHMGNRELIAPLKELMVMVSEAYRTLGNEEKRAAYDKRLAAMGGFSMHREKTETTESIEEWLKRANECLRAKNFVGSVLWLRKCQEAAPEQALYRALLARSLGTIPQYQREAIDHFEKAIELDPWREPVLVQFAELLERMELPLRACEVYSKIMEINPTNAAARERLAALGSVEKDERHPKLVSQFFGRKG
jgi:tetratricopeptide (TPR) repeat protein